MRRALAIAALLLAAGSVRADVGPFIPATRYANPVHVIETADPHPNHVFVVARAGLPTKGQLTAEFVALGPGQPLSLPTGYYDEPELIIIPRKLAEPFQTAAELAKAARDGEIPGVTRRKFPFRETVPVWADRTLAITYRLDRTDTGEGWEFVRTSWSPMWQWYAAAGLATAAVVLGGWWVVRRLRGPRAVAPAR